MKRQSFTIKRRTILKSALAAPFVLGARPLLAADYPDHPIKMIMTLPPGNSADATCRFVADKLTQSLGQPVVVENKPGASSNIGYRTAAGAPADGYTLLFGLLSLVMNPHLFSSVPYQVSDFTPIMHLMDVPFLIMVRADSPYQTLNDLLEAARANPGKLKYPSYGQGSPNHVGMLEIFQKAGVEMTHVPYKDGGLTDLLGGALDCSMDVTAAGVPHIKAGELRALAATTRDRLEVLPDVPTVTELGVSRPLLSWNGLFGRTGTPQPFLDKIASAVQPIVASDDFKTLAKGFTQIPGSGTPADFEAFVAAESESWGKVIQTANLKLD